MTQNWTSIIGDYEFKKNELTFKGSHYVGSDNQKRPTIANFLCDEYFGGGRVLADITFTNKTIPMGCEIIIYYDPLTKNFVSAGIGGSGFMYSIRTFNGNGWTNHAVTGDINQLKAKTYKIEIGLKGSTVNLKVDNIDVLIVNLPYTLPISQTGIWCQGSEDIIVKNFKVEREIPKAFVVMQFSSPFNELYQEVIKSVCEKFKLNVIRADETYGPGIILTDITKQINESRLIIAEITNPNPNVFYEVGYAHALNKPTILIAESGTKLPFDVSSFRTLFYENTIAGKQKIELGLEKHIESVLSEIDLY
jgi:hypothetical protein